MSFKCPACGKPLYNRRKATCGACGKAVPEHLLLSEDQRQRLAGMRKREEKEHREFMEREFPGGDPSGGAGTSV